MTVPDVESSQKIINKIVFKMFHLDFDLRVCFFFQFSKECFWSLVLFTKYYLQNNNKYVNEDDENK